MTMLHEEKPSLEDALQHFGRKGMRWGVRTKPSTSEIVRARGKMTQRSADIIKARENVRAGTGTKAQVKKAKQKWKDDPTRQVAKRMTKGEKASLAIYGGLAAISIASIVGSAAS